MRNILHNLKLGFHDESGEGFLSEALELGFFSLSRCLVKKGNLGTVCSPVVIVKDQNMCQYAVKTHIVITKLPGQQQAPEW